MSTAAQIAANQINAQASTGPRTEEGKARSAANSRSFGLFSSRGLVRPEEIEEHDQLRASLAEQLKPDTILEHAMAAQILHAVWRLFLLCNFKSLFLKSNGFFGFRRGIGYGSHLASCFVKLIF